MIFYFPSLAVMKRAHEFIGVEIPFNLKHKDSIIEKGKYDFEILFHRQERVFFLIIKKEGKSLCFLRGEELKYRNSEGVILHTAELWQDPEVVPKEASLQIKRHPGKKVNIIFESGKETAVYPLRKIRFEMECE